MRPSCTVYFVCVILLIEIAAASPLAEPCSGADGKGSNCKEVIATRNGCSEGQCSSQRQQDKRHSLEVERLHDSFDPLSEDQVCPNCSLKEQTIKEAFASAHFAVRGRVLRARLMGVTHVLVVLMVQLVMKSTHVMLTPGRMVIAVPLRSSWECDCPGVRNFELEETYLITGFVTKTPSSKSSDYLLEVNHQSSVVQWDESILDDMRTHRSDYPHLKLIPHWRLYKMYFVW